jgi:hypothetical protein
MLTLIVVVAGMLLAIVLVVNNRQHDNPAPPGSSTITTPGESADEAAAKRLDALLTSSVAGRKHLLTAIDSALACDKSEAITEMKAASSARKALITKAGSTDLAALPDLKSALLAFLRASYAADQAYLRWAQSAGGCPSTKAASFGAVESANTRARATKTEFLEAWTPVAERYDLPARDVSSI